MTGAETAALRLLATGFDQLNAALTAHLRDCPHVAPPISRGDLLLVQARGQAAVERLVLAGVNPLFKEQRRHRLAWVLVASAFQD